jgi:hypothetical protein
MGFLAAGKALRGRLSAFIPWCYFPSWHRIPPCAASGMGSLRTARTTGPMRSPFGGEVLVRHSPVWEADLSEARDAATNGQPGISGLFWPSGSSGQLEDSSMTRTQETGRSPSHVAMTRNLHAGAGDDDTEHQKCGDERWTGFPCPSQPPPRAPISDPRSAAGMADLDAADVSAALHGRLCWPGTIAYATLNGGLCQGQTGTRHAAANGHGAAATASEKKNSSAASPSTAPARIGGERICSLPTCGA